MNKATRTRIHTIARAAVSALLCLAMMLGAALSLCSCSIVKYELRVGVYDTVSDNSTSAEGTVAMLLLTSDGRKVEKLRLDRVCFTAGMSGGAAEVASVHVEGDNSDSAWMQDAAKLEKHAEGKSVDTLLAMTDEDIAALGISIPTAPLREAIRRAVDCPHRKILRESGDLAAGLDISVTQELSWDGSITVTCDIGGTIMKDGKVRGAIIDSWCPAVRTASTDGVSTAVITTTATKLAAYKNYNMAAVSSTKTEWYAQAQIFADTAEGLTAAELADMPAGENEVAGCTIKLESYKVALIAAAANAR